MTDSKSNMKRLNIQRGKPMMDGVDSLTPAQRDHTAVELTYMGITWEFTFQMVAGTTPKDIAQALSSLAVGKVEMKHLKGGM